MPRLVGRGAEVAQVAAALDRSLALVLVEGEAGIGKSRLIREVFGLPAVEDRKVLVAACPPFRTPHTLGAVVEAVRLAADGLAWSGLSPLGGALRPLFPEWSEVLPRDLEPAEDPTAARHRLFRALAELLGLLQVDVLAVEDAHWADDATLEFLLFLVTRSAERLTLVVTCRPEDVPAGSLLLRLSRQASGATGVRVSLGPLDLEATAGLVSSMLDDRQVSDEFASFLHRRTDGIPLMVEECVRLLNDRADVTVRNREWMRRPLDRIGVPPSIRDAVLERAERLGDDANSILDAAAVLGDEADEVTLSSVGGVSVDRARAGLEDALGSGLVQDNGRGLVSFRHVLASQAVYDRIAAPRRRAMHVRAGSTLEARSPLPLTQLTRHFREAGDISQWCRYGEQAADIALAIGDEASAGELLYSLVIRGGLPAEDVARLTAKITMASIAGEARWHDLAGALRSVLQAGPLQPRDEADIRWQLARVLMASDDYDASRVELDRALPHMSHDPVRAARAMVLLGWPREPTWPASTHLEWLRRSAQLPTPDGASDRLGLAVDRATALLMLGEEAGWAEADALRTDPTDAKGRLQVTAGNLNIGDQAMLWGRYADARRRLDLALQLAESHQYFHILDLILVTRLHLDWFTGAWHGLAQKVDGLGQDDDLHPGARFEAGLIMGLLHAATGVQAEAEKELQLALQETRRHGAIQLFMEPAGALAKLWLAAGRVEDALRITDEAAEIVATKQIWTWATEIAPVRVGSLAAAGRVAEAAVLVEAFGRGLGGRDAPAAQAALALCRATLAQVKGEPAEAALLFGEAVVAWQRLPRPYEAFLARERQAHCLLITDQGEMGLALLTDALRDFSILGATADADRIASTLRERGLSTRHVWRGGTRGYGNELSPRELEVVQLIITGRTTRQAAEILSRSPNTVSKQLKSAMVKLAADSLVTLASRAREAGIGVGETRSPR